MRRSVRSVAAALLTTGLLVPAAAAHATATGPAPTISGPARAGYYATVTLTGTTPQAGQAVTVFFRRAGATSYTAGRHVVSDASGRYTTTYVETAAYAYYAVAGGVRSTTRVTRVPAASCSVSRPAFGLLAFQKQDPAPTPKDAFSAFTATRNGVWAGYAFLQFPQEWAAITWRRGDRRATVLARFRPGSGTYYPNAHGNVDIAGIAPDGAVVAAVRTRNSTQNTTGFAWFHGHTYHLATRANWRSVHPRGVTGTGAVFGWVRAVVSGRSAYYFVEWPRWNEAAVPLLRVAVGAAWTMVVDDRGDIAYALADGTARVRLRSGSVRRLVGTTDQWANVYAAAGRYVYGIDAWNNGELRWDLAAVPATGPVATDVKIAPQGVVTAGSARGDILLDRMTGADREILRTAGGARVVTPRQLAAYGWAGQAIDEHGVVAFTSPGDGLVHFLRCS